MDHQVGPLWLQLLLLWLGLALNSILPAQDAGTVGPVQVADGVVRLSAPEDQGVPLEEFIKIGHYVTGKAFTYSAQAVARAGKPIRFVGTVSTAEDRFFSFFQTMLYVHGFACVIRGEGAREVVELVYMGGPRSGRQIRFVDPADLSSYRDQAEERIYTLIPLQHLDLRAVADKLRPFLGWGLRNLEVSALGNSTVFLEGPGPQVYQASRLIGLVDVPQEVDDTMVRTVKLEHVSASEIVDLLETLLAGRRGEIRIETGDAATLTVTGEPEAVGRVVELIAILDK